MNREGYAQSSLFRIMWETVTADRNCGSSYKPDGEASIADPCYLLTGIRSAKDSIIMLEQIRTIDKSRLLEYIGHLDHRDMRAVDISLGISLDMVPESGGIFGRRGRNREWC